MDVRAVGCGAQAGVHYASAQRMPAVPKSAVSQSSGRRRFVDRCFTRSLCESPSRGPFDGLRVNGADQRFLELAAFFFVASGLRPGSVTSFQKLCSTTTS
jgi:hypothetical protein